MAQQWTYQDMTAKVTQMKQYHKLKHRATLEESKYINVFEWSSQRDDPNPS